MSKILLGSCKKKPIFDMLICLWLTVSIVALYYPVIFFDFINYDTAEYVYENIHVKQGLTLNNIMWAFSTTYFSNWHPITWLSHMLDVELFGMKPGAHHAVNLFFHVINSVLLYWSIKRLSGSFWSSWFIASLFALHPLHVQSVVWVAERKDVLSTMFGFMSILSYCYYTHKRELVYYLLMLLFFLLSLLTKPMLVTMPFILLLIDYWPLNRFNVKEREPAVLNNEYRVPVSLLIEKIPLLLLAAGSSIMTIYAQHEGGAISSLTELSIESRLLNAVYSYARYLFLMFYPVKLAVIYPYPKGVSLYNLFFSSLFVISMSAFSLWHVKRKPWFFVGWFFFIGTLLPVIGIIQVGMQAMADRYTYVPLIGLFIIMAGVINYFRKQFSFSKMARWPLAFLLLLTLSVLSSNQIRYWESSVTLFSRTVKVTKDNYIAHNNLGYAFLEKKDLDKAAFHFVNAIKINPDFAIAHLNYGVVLAKQNNISGSINQYQTALRLKTDYVDAHINLGNLYFRMAKYSEAFKHYLGAYNLQHENVSALNGIGGVMVKKGEIGKGIYFFKKALEINPDDANTRHNLKKILDSIKAE